MLNHRNERSICTLGVSNPPQKVKYKRNCEFHLVNNLNTFVQMYDTLTMVLKTSQQFFNLESQKDADDDFLPNRPAV
jgi:hypothetical protein